MQGERSASHSEGFKDQKYFFCRGPGGPKSRSGRFREEKYPLHLPTFEPGSLSPKTTDFNPQLSCCYYRHRRRRRRRRRRHCHIKIIFALRV